MPASSPKGRTATQENGRYLDLAQASRCSATGQGALADMQGWAPHSRGSVTISHAAMTNVGPDLASRRVSWPSIHLVNMRPFRSARWPHAALLALLVSALPLQSSAQANTQASRYYEDALVRYEKKDMPGAIIQLKNALKIDKNMLPVHVLLGKALLENGDVIAAEVAFTEALRLGVNRAEVVLPLTRAVLAQGNAKQVLEQERFSDNGLPPATRYELLVKKAGAADDTGDRKTALQLLDAARAIDVNSPDSWLAETTLRIRAGQLKDAQAASDMALALAPGMAQALYVRGTVAHVQGDLQGALGYYDKALQDVPEHAEALVSRAGLLMDLHRLTEAKRDVHALLKIEAEDPRGSYLSALIAEREGRPADAKAALADVTALLDPAPIETLRYRPQFLMLGGLSHFGLDQTEKAKPYLEALLRDQPGSPVAKLMARIHLKENNVDRAIETLDVYLRAHPQDSQATLLLASAHMAQGRHARAVSLLQAAMLRDDRPEYQSALGLAMMKSGQLKSAFPELDSAFKRNPNQVQAGTALAALYLQARQPGKALAIAEQLNKRWPVQPGLLHLLGVARSSKGDVKGAKEALAGAAKLDPNFIEPLVELARLDLSAGAVDAALARLNSAVGKNAKHVGALTLIGQLHAHQGRLEEAQRWLEKADDHSARDALDAGVRLVDFHLAHNQLDRARETLKRLTGRAPEALRVVLTQARVELAVGDTRAARTLLTRASGLAAYDTSTLVRIAELQLAAGDTAGAGHSLRKALNDTPTHFGARVLLTRVDILEGKYADAEQRARQIIASRPKSSAGQWLLGDLALARQQPAAAVDAYRRAHQVDNNAASLLKLFGLLTRIDQPQAIRLAEQWLKTRPDDTGVRRALADAHARGSNWPAARAAYEAVLRSAPDDAETANNLANVLLILKHPSALTVAERALALKPGAAHVISTVGWAAHHAGQNDRALQLLRDARLRNPNSAETRYYLAATLASAGRNAEAKVELQEALKGGRTFASANAAERLLQTLK